MLKILIVEDDKQLATTLKYLVEDNPRYRVVAIAEDEINEFVQRGTVAVEKGVERAGLPALDFLDEFVIGCACHT